MHATALFTDRHSAHAAVEQLVQAGFARDALTVAMSEATHDREFGSSAGRSSGVRPVPPTGGVLASIVASLQAFVLRGGASLRVAGPLVTSLGRAGTLSEALTAAGLAHEHAPAVKNGLAAGGIAVGVHTDKDRMELAKQLLELAGGEAVQAA